jgi:restriction system protein
MDIFPFLKLNLFWLIFPLAMLVGILRSPWFKGIVGEMFVRFSAKLFLDNAEFRRLHNITLPTIDGTTQIDHIFVSRYGIFVVETKNLSGWIFGDAKQATWTQKLYKKTYKIQNPLRQNFKHIKALEYALNLPSENFHSVIVFTGGGTFKTPMPPNVTYIGGFLAYLKSKKDILFSPPEVKAIIHKIEIGRLKASFATTREHIRHIELKRDTERSNLCSPKHDWRA